MRYAIASLVFMTAGCSENPREAARAGLERIATGLHEQADKPAAASPGAKPIPQDDAKVAERERQRMEWHLRTSVGAYDKVGKKDPRWDDPARKAVDLAVRQSFQPGSKITATEVNRAAKAAVDAGCDDSLVALLYARSSTAETAVEREKLGRLQRDAIWAYAASRYPAFRRAGTLESYAGGLMRDRSDEAGKEIERALDAALALLPEGAKSDERNGFWVDRWQDTVIGVIKNYRRFGMDAEAAYKRADAKMAGIPELAELRLLVRGAFWFDYGWEARTGAFAPNVPAGGFDSLEERLAIAKEAFEGAWKVRPENASAAVYLMDIDKSIGGDRATMELWFDRAMRADGDRRNACLIKLDWLDPKWHGTYPEMLAFGLACRDTKNWRAGITLLAADAHMRMACSPDEDQNKYLARPEVWADIRSVYDEYLKHYPTDYVARSKFAMLSYLGAHWREAEVQFVAAGDHLTQWREFPFFPLFVMKQARERNARVVLSKEGQIAFPGWHFVGSKFDKGEWRVNIPVQISHKQKPGVLGPEPIHSWTCSADGITYEIRLLNIPDALKSESHDRILEAERAAVAKERGEQPRNLRDTLLAARPAQEYDIELPGPKSMQLRVKTIILEGVIYELSVMASKDDVMGRSAVEFFDSFAFQPKAKPSLEEGEL